MVSLADGGYLAVWAEQALDLDVGLFKEVKHIQSSRVQAHRLDASGAPVGELVTLGPGAGLETRAAAARLDDGDVVVVWESTQARLDPPSDQDGVWGQRLSGTGEPRGEAFRIDVPAKAPETTETEDTATIQATRAVVAPLGKKGFVIAWEACCDSAGDGGVFARRYESGTEPAGAPFEVPAAAADKQEHPVIARGVDGAYLLAWIAPTPEHENNHRVYGRRLTPDGKPTGDDLKVGSPMGRPDGALGITSGERGYLVAWTVWTSNVPTGVFASQVETDGERVGDSVFVSDHTVNIQWLLALASDGGERYVAAWESYGHDDRPAIALRPFVLRAPGDESGDESGDEPAAPATESR